MVYFYFYSSRRVPSSAAEMARPETCGLVGHTVTLCSWSYVSRLNSPDLTGNGVCSMYLEIDLWTGWGLLRGKNDPRMGNRAGSGRDPAKMLQKASVWNYWNYVDSSSSSYSSSEATFSSKRALGGSSTIRSAELNDGIVMIDDWFVVCLFLCLCGDVSLYQFVYPVEKLCRWKCVRASRSQNSQVLQLDSPLEFPCSLWHWPGLSGNPQS